MLTKEILKFQVRCRLMPNGVSVSVAEGAEEKRIPLFPDIDQVNRALAALEKTQIDAKATLNYFSMIVAGCLMIKMKRRLPL
jgi:hypothetical protein